MAAPRKTEPEAAEAPSQASVAGQATSGPAQGRTAAQGGVTRRYRATRGLGRVRRGDVFEAADDDPRVLSGYVERLDNDAPDDVKAALES